MPPKPFPHPLHSLIIVGFAPKASNSSDPILYITTAAREMLTGDRMRVMTNRDCKGESRNRRTQSSTEQALQSMVTHIIHSVIKMDIAFYSCAVPTMLFVHTSQI